MPNSAAQAAPCVAAGLPPWPAAPPVQMSKMLVGMVVPFAVVQLLKRFDQTSEEFLKWLRTAFFSMIALNTAVQMILQWKIRSTADATPVKTPPNPLAMLMGHERPNELTT